MKRKHKTYSRPKRPFEKERILEENEIRNEFGLKNKREIWKAEARIKELRNKAKSLISGSEKDQKLFFDKIRKMGLKAESIGDVLALDKRDYLKRRLQTVLVDKKFATTPKAARQLITHRKVSVDGKLVDSPSYIVEVDLENKIKVKDKKIKKVDKKEIENDKEN
jgi:small subunit ribosomal protein S4